MIYQITVTFTEPLLGTAPLDDDLYTQYIATKREKAGNEPLNGTALLEELETLEESDEKGATGFHRQDGKPFLYDYVPLGFFKDACQMLRYVTGSESKKVKAYKKIIDGTVFVYPRRIPLEFDGEIEWNERPLRAQTMQGERVTLAKSEMLPAGTRMAFEVETLSDDAVPLELLREWLDYGSKRGIGQWRNSSYGRFEYELTPKP